MREILHVLITAVVVLVAAVCTLVQLSDADQALERFDGDPTVIQQMSSGR
ncbi:hypothetical protein [Nocardioides sp. SR21]|nr:hypothetical protein [Nocardioides sp. SR21]